MLCSAPTNFSLYGFVGWGAGTAHTIAAVPFAEFASDDERQLRLSSWSDGPWQSDSVNQGAARHASDFHRDLHAELRADRYRLQSCAGTITPTAGARIPRTAQIVNGTVHSVSANSLLAGYHFVSWAAIWRHDKPHQSDDQR